jgi:hypothetical protein
LPYEKDELNAIPNEQQLGRDSTWFLGPLIRKDGRVGKIDQKRRWNLKTGQEERSKKTKPGFEPGLADNL